MEWVSWIVVGLIAGWLAGMVMKGGGYGVIGDIIVGVVGGLLGGWIANHPKRPMKAKLIFNPGAGATGESPVQLMDVIREMQAWKLIPDPFLVEPGCDCQGWSRMP